MKPERREDLERIALELRKDVVRMIGVARSGRLDSALSLVDLLAYLYWEVLEVDPRSPRDPRRDRFLLSKGRGCPALYAALARRGFFPREELWSFRRLGALLQGYPEVGRAPGVEAPGGSMGMGLGLAVGLSLALRLDGLPSRVFCLLGDGELQEGAVWEAVLSASVRRLGRLVALVEANEHHEEGSWKAMKGIEPIRRKFEAFGWEVLDAEGHDMEKLEEAFCGLREDREAPMAILLRTQTGKGVSFAEEGRGGDRGLSREDVDRALSELEVRGGGTGDA